MHKFCCCLTSKYTRHSLLVSFLLLKALVIPFSLSFSFKESKPNFPSCFNKSKYISRNLDYAFQPLNMNLTLRLILTFSNTNHMCYILLLVNLESSPSIFTSKDNSGTLFCVCLLLNTLFLLFVSIFITKCNKGTYFVAV